MRKVFRFLTVLIILAAGLVGARFLWAKYWLGKKEITLGTTIEETKKDLFSKGEQLNEELGKVLGESEKDQSEVSSYIRQELPQVIKTEIEKSEVVREIKEEVVKIVEQATQQVKELPEKQVKKIKREISEEICKQLLKEE